MTDIIDEQIALMHAAADECMSPEQRDLFDALGFGDRDNDVFARLFRCVAKRALQSERNAAAPRSYADEQIDYDAWIEKAKQEGHATGSWAAWVARAASPADHSQCCDTPALCSSVRRCTAKDAAAPAQPGEPRGFNEGFNEGWDRGNAAGLKGIDPNRLTEVVGFVRRPAPNGDDFSVSWTSAPEDGTRLYAAPPAQTDRALTEWERKCLTFAGQHLLRDGFTKEADALLNLCAQPAPGVTNE